jgi:putative pyruvate formate lyase activating enzyme
MDAERKIAAVDRALAALSPAETTCVLCPRNCRVDRTRDERGICQTGRAAAVSHALLHFGEEPVLSGYHDARREPGPEGRTGRAGSGTVFFAGCNLKCLFCQNYQLSWLNEGAPADDDALAGMMLDLQARGALNINLVSPTHVVVPILRALRIAYVRGLDLPLVWNSNGYEHAAIVRALDGIVDVYLPDLKFHDGRISKRYAGAADYFDHAAPALVEMSVQRPVVETNADGTALRGLIIRHLVLPGHTDDSLRLLRWMRERLSPFAGLSLMSQYHPVHKAPEELPLKLGREEYRRAADLAVELGFDPLFLQPEPFAPGENLVPDFDRREPFRWKK